MWIDIDQDRRGPAELGDACSDLGDLRIVVRARIAGVGNQRLDLAVLDVERVHADAGPENEKPADESRGGWSGIDGGVRTCEPCEPQFATRR